MKPCKRIEIVLEQTLSAKLEGLLSSLNADAYTVIPEAGGLGERGYRRADEVTGTSSNCIFIIAVHDEQLVEKIIEAIRPMLSLSGGVCIVSDAFFVQH